MSKWGPVATELAAALCAQITVDGLPEPCFCGLLPGEQVAFDYCAPCNDISGQCGMAWVRMTGVTMEQFETGSTCILVQQATFEVGIARCAPGLDADGQPPSVEEQDASTQAQITEADTIYCAINEALKDKRADWSIGAYRPIGPQGLCVGGSWTVTIAEV